MDVGQILRVDGQMTVGSITQWVRVSGTVANVEIETGPSLTLCREVGHGAESERLESVNYPRPFTATLR